MKKTLIGIVYWAVGMAGGAYHIHLRQPVRVDDVPLVVMSGVLGPFIWVDLARHSHVKKENEPTPYKFSPLAPLDEEVDTLYKFSQLAPLTVKQPCMVVDRAEEKTGAYVTYIVRCLEYTGKFTEGKAQP